MTAYSATERRFRIMDGLPSIPWSAIAPYEDNAKANHDQSLERLNERGGLEVCELWAVVHGKRVREAPPVAECRAWFDMWRASHEGPQATIDKLRRELDAARGEIERLQSQTYANWQIASDRDRLTSELAERNAQLDAMRAAVSAECVEHVELNGYIDIAEQCRDYLSHETMDNGDPSGKLRDFGKALRIVIDQCDLQRRRANWYEAAYTAGKTKLIESAVESALSRARSAAQVYVERVDALGLAADDSDPRVMATAEPIGAAQADLYAALGLLERSESGEVVIKPPTETIEQLRAERDTARMLADVRGSERDRLAAELERVKGERDQWKRQCLAHDMVRTTFGVALTAEERGAIEAAREHWGPPETADTPELLAERRNVYAVLDRLLGRPVKIRINLDDPETRATWGAVQRAKEEVASWPAWKRGEVPSTGRPAALTAEEREALSDLARDIRRAHRRAADANYAPHHDALAVLDKLLATKEGR